MRNRLLLINLLSILLIFLSCGDENAGGGSGGHMLSGTFIDEAKKPVEGALVIVFTEDSLAVDTVYTDMNGEFQFKTLATGVYDISALYKDNSDTLSAFIADIIYDTLLDVGTHIMKKPGKIEGVVRLYSNDHEGIDCYIPGTSFMAKSDGGGYFTISGISPAEDYSVSFIANGYSRKSIHEIVVKSDSITLLDTIYLELDTALSPPKVEGLSSVYDAVTGIATLTWLPMPLSDLRGYIVYGKSSIDNQLVELDTVIGDKQEYTDSLWSKVYALSDKKYQYQLKALDTENNLSISYSKATEVSPEKGPSVLMSVTVTGELTDAYDLIDSVSVSVYDTLQIVASKKNAWKEGVLTFSQTLQVPKSMDSLSCEIKVYDSANKVVGYTYLAQQSFADTIIIPAFNAFNAKPVITIDSLSDTVAFYGDSLEISFTVRDSFYSSIEYLCKGEGATEYIRCDSGRCRIEVPPKADNSYTMYVKVVDDDENSAVDSVSIPINVWTTVSGSEKNESAMDIVRVDEDKLVMISYVTSDIDPKYPVISMINNNGNSYWSKVINRNIYCEMRRVAIIGNFIYLTGEMNKELLVMKLDMNGSLIWEKTFGGLGHDMGFSIHASSDNGILVTGRYTSIEDNVDLWILKISSNGKLLWDKKYGGGEFDRGRSIIENPHTGIIYVAGETASFGEGSIDIWLLCLDKNGDTLWTKTYGGSQEEDANTLIMTSDNHLLISGRTESFGAGGVDIYIVKTTMEGDTVWTKTIGSIDDDFGGGIFEARDNNYIVTGGKKSFEYLSTDAWLAKISHSGTLIWEHLYGISDYAEYSFSVCETGDEGYILAGGIKINGGIPDILLIKTDSEGKTPVAEY